MPDVYKDALEQAQAAPAPPAAYVYYLAEIIMIFTNTIAVQLLLSQGEVAPTRKLRTGSASANVTVTTVIVTVIETTVTAIATITTEDIMTAVEDMGLTSRTGW
jgi:hypothetical protein